MAEKSQPQTKRLKIDKANATMVSVVAIAAFIVVFALVSSKVLISQYAYQNRVISAKQTAVNQLKSDSSSVVNLVTAYKAFVSPPQNIIGGTTDGDTQNDGDNGKIILDALPSTYDFPGLISSLEYILSSPSYSIDSISGTDEQLTQGVQPAGTPSPVQIPFSISVNGTYQSIQTLINTMQASIRPIVIQTVDLSGSDTDLSADITAYTYYQPAKSFTIQTEEVK